MCHSENYVIYCSFKQNFRDSAAVIKDIRHAFPKGTYCNLHCQIVLLRCFILEAFKIQQ